jgi:hypothetical protein
VLRPSHNLHGVLCERMLQSQVPVISCIKLTLQSTALHNCQLLCALVQLILFVHVVVLTCLYVLLLLLLYAGAWAPNLQACTCAAGHA